MASVLCSREFSPDLVEVGEARRFVRASLPPRIEAWTADIVLVVSELVSNAVLHARGCFTVTVSQARSGVRVEVTDPNPRLPVVSEATPSALSGRGLLMVQAITSAWGVQAHPGAGKTVWAEVLLDARTDGDTDANGAHSQGAGSQGARSQGARSQAARSH